LHTISALSAEYWALGAAAFVGGIVSGFAGFAFSAAAGAILLHFMEPKLAIPLMMFCSITFAPRPALPAHHHGVSERAHQVVPLLDVLREAHDRWPQCRAHRGAAHAPSLRLWLVYHTAVDGSASLDLKRGGLGELGGGLGDARPICDGKLLSQGCFEL
jgi:hypothetical protein